MIGSEGGRAGTILCFNCGAAIVPNDVNMCASCLKDRVDLSEGISREETIWNCSSCGKTRAEDGRWLLCAPESPELLGLCLKTVHGLGRGKGNKSGAKFVDAAWIWTEPHSQRLKMKLTVEKEVLNSATVRQKFDVTFVQKRRMCPDCVKETTNQEWTAVVQLRQQVQHKRTLLNLENRLLRVPAAKAALDVKPVSSGIDFYFGNKNQANKFIDVVMSSVPARKKESKDLRGSDRKSNVYNFQHTIAIEVVPLCKHDFVVLPPKLQQSLFGGSVAYAVVENVTKTVNLIEPTTGVRAKLSDAKFFANPFSAISSSKTGFTEFTILDVQPLRSSHKPLATASSLNEGDTSDVHIWEVEVARMADLGINDERFVVNSHIGRILNPGDSVLGYDFANFNIPEDLSKFLKGRDLPPVVLLQKTNHVPDKPRKPSNSENTDSLPFDSINELVIDPEGLAMDDEDGATDQQASASEPIIVEKTT